MQKIKFIHVADLHLDSPFKGITKVSLELGQKLKESTFTAFSKVVQTAIKEQVDFVIIAGDIFDIEDRSIRAQLRFKKDLERLINENIGVFICFGNHDYVSNKKNDFLFDERVVIFTEQPQQVKFQTKSKVDVYLYGFSYNQRHIKERKIEEYPVAKGEGFHIGILHGQLELSTDQDNYAPFTIEDLLEKRMDYWALGHIHQRQILNEEPFIVYPGNIQGRHKNEDGIKGGYIIELDRHQVDLQFFETSTIIWEQIEFNAEGYTTLEQLINDLIIEKEKNRFVHSKMIHLKLTHVSSQLDLTNELLDEIISTLNEEEDFQQAFMFIYEIEVETSWELSSIFTNSDFYQRLFDPLNDEEYTKELLNTIYPKKHKKLDLQLNDFSIIEKKGDERLKQLLSKGGIV